MKSIDVYLHTQLDIRIMTTTSNPFTVEAQASNVGTWTKIQILMTSEGWSKIMKNGEWVNFKFEKSEKVIVELGKYFQDNAAAEKFMQTKSFKRLLKAVEKDALLLI
mgnify:CR=1 FL=1